MISLEIMNDFDTFKIALKCGDLGKLIVATCLVSQSTINRPIWSHWIGDEACR